MKVHLWLPSMSKASVLVLIVVLGALPRAAVPCDQWSQSPSASDLVTLADDIIVARAVRAVAPIMLSIDGVPDRWRMIGSRSSPQAFTRVSCEGAWECGSSRFQYQLLEFEVVESIVGSFEPGDRLLTFGQVHFYFGASDGAIPLVEPRGEPGACYATDYKLGATYALLLFGDVLHRYSLVPVNEEVFSAVDPWVLWLRKEASQRRPSEVGGTQ